MIERVYVCGLGALGGMFAQSLGRVPQIDLRVVAAGERAERYRRQGVTVNGSPLAVSVLSPDQPAAPADLLLIGVKWHQLPEAIGAVRPFVGPETVILSLLNGIASEGVIAQAVGADKVLYSFVVETDAVRQGDDIRYGRLGTIVFGEAQNPVPSARVAAVAGLLGRAGIPHRVPADMLRELWWKFMLNVGVNQVSAVLRVGYGAFQTLPEARELVRMACREVVAIADRSGIALAEDDIDSIFPILGRLSPERKTSMLQDMEAGRKTEVEIFGGTVVAEGRRLGVATPVNAVLLNMIRTLECCRDPAA